MTNQPELNGSGSKTELKTEPNFCFNTKGFDILDTRPSVSLISEAFPGEMLGPSSKKEEPEDSIIICIRINQFKRCKIGSEIFSSKILCRYVKSSFVMAKFITIDDDIDVYFGQVQYYFTHTVDLSNGPAKHFLAYV
ncbi:unnamed protein product [Rhizophagus irregularis]|nr:unnamed protein product [Rhizophagus irregularis]